MDKRYCKHCGQLITISYGQEEYTCLSCGNKGSFKDLVAQWTLDARMKQLKAMHELLCECNDERIYMNWIYLMPDCPTKEDFFDIALDEEQYNECWELFLKLVKSDGIRW